MPSISLTSRWLWATALLAGTASAIIGAAPAARADAPCTPYELPTASGPGGAGDVIAISDAGLYVGDVQDTGDGHGHAAYWTHAGSDLATGWTVHFVPSGLVDDVLVDVNANGVMVGVGTDPTTGAYRGYVYNPASGDVTMLLGLGGGYDEGRRLNDSGVVSGLSADTHGVAYAVTWTPPYTAPDKLPAVGAAQSVGTRDGAHIKLFSEALGINNAGQTVGETSIGAPVPQTGQLASNGSWRGGLSPLFRPVTWAANGAPSKLPVGWAQGFAWDINDAGLIVGNSDIDSSDTARPAYWVNGLYHDMGAPADIQFGNAYSLRGDWSAGGVILADGTSRAFVWTGAGSLQLLAPSAGFIGSWSHGPNEALHEVGGAMDNGSAGVPTVWQCRDGFTTG